MLQGYTKEHVHHFAETQLDNEFREKFIPLLSALDQIDLEENEVLDARQLRRLFFETLQGSLSEPEIKDVYTQCRNKLMNHLQQEGNTREVILVEKQPGWHVYLLNLRIRAKVETLILVEDEEMMEAGEKQADFVSQNNKDNIYFDYI